MTDTHGREFLENEFLQLKKQGIIDETKVQSTMGITDGTCHRCLNSQPADFGTFCYKNNHTVYCRKCLDFGMVSDKTKLYRIASTRQIPPEAGVLNADFQLSTLQQRASDFSQNILKAKKTGLIWAVCGAGKTEMMFEPIAAALTTGKRVCWAIPRSDVVIDLTPRIKEAFPNAKVVTLHGNSDEKACYGDIVVTTVHQMIRFYEAFDVLIIDEVDAFPYTFDAMLTRIAKRACKPDAATIYLSATPSKSDQAKIKKGTLPACIIPARYHLFPLDVPKYKWCANFYKQVAKNKLPPAAKGWLSRKIKEKRRALLFVPTIDCGLKFQQALKAQLNLTVDFVYSSDPDRTKKVAQYKQGEPQFLITTMILERGVTIPNIDVAIFAAEHDIYEESALVQISGRVGRNPKWPTGDIIFFHHGITKAMEDAKTQIIRMNQAARQQGLLKELPS
ncbi:MAG: DEAD/DEAH box helicase family protein [Turicibacter sp.]|nr:DEAD/DEAH box helicase family protein [Turicibacter sp.]